MKTKKLDYLLPSIEAYIEKYDVLNLKVSRASVGWHLDHSVKVINKISDTLQKSNPNTYKNNFTFLGRLFFALGYFPRGKAKSPKYVTPPEVIVKEDIILQIKAAKINIINIANLETNAYFKHPIFGHINKKRVSKFLVLHTDHHLKIVRDILSSQ